MSISPPRGLTRPARAAWGRAVSALVHAGRDPEVMADAVLRYARAVDDVERLRADWGRLGCPALAAGGATGTAEVPHPLVKMIRDAEAAALVHAEVVGLGEAKRAPGRPVGATSAPDRKMPPRVTKLKAV